MDNNNSNNQTIEEGSPNNNHDQIINYIGGGSSNASTPQHSTDEEISATHFMEGYTPLNFNMNNMMSIHGDSDDADVDNAADMNGDDFANNGYYYMLGAPPKRVNGVKDYAIMGYSTGHDDREDSKDDDSASFDNQNTVDTSSSSELHIPVDFHSLADQALRGLEDDHRATLELSTSAEIPSIDETLNTSIPLSTDRTKVNEAGDATTSNFDTIIFPPRLLEEETTEPAAINAAKPKAMNINAIKKAMQSIRLKSPQLANTLDAGASSSFFPSSIAMQISLKSVINFTLQSIQSKEPQNTNHAIIPPGPLAAFRRSTPKAKSASANLSRSATLAEAVLRLWPLISFQRRMREMGFGEKKSQYQTKHSKALIIHILGCDHVECSSEETVRKSVGPFTRWMNAALQSGVLSTMKTSTECTHSEIDSLVIEFSGPNIPNWIIGREINLLSSSSSESGRLVSATAIFHQGEYHEQRTDKADDMSTPDVAIAFNAGIWGYDSWEPSLSFLCAPRIDSYACTLIVVTAYTLEECEDDAEVISKVAGEAIAKLKQVTKHDDDDDDDDDEEEEEEEGNTILALQLWAPESNPFSSKIERKTASVPGRKYFENNAWQAWLLGPTRDGR